MSMPSEEKALNKAEYMLWLLRKIDWIAEDPDLPPVRNNKQFIRWAENLIKVVKEDLK